MYALKASKLNIIAGILATFLLVCIHPAFGADNEVTIGIVQPLSGPNAQFGINAMHGSELVAETINAQGGIKSLGGARIKLVVADVPTPNTAAAATQRLISQNKVVGIVGTFVSSTTLGVSEVTERAGVPIVTFAFADQITERGYRYVFQVSPKGTAFGQAQLKYAIELGKAGGEAIDKIAILYEDTAYGTAQAKGLREAAVEAGIKVVVDEAYPLGITDVSSLVNKVRTSEAKIVFPVSYLNDSLLIIRTMRQQQMDIPVIGGAAGYIIPDFRKGLGDLAQNVLSVASSNHDLYPDLASRFKDKYGSFMTHEALMHAASLAVLAKAVEKAGSKDPEKVRDALASTDDCDGFARCVPGGCVRFNEAGLNTRAFPIMVQWQGEEPVTVYPKEVARAAAVWHAKSGR
ncbi:MAG: ABC transporter substrate-binding protein [Syntrophobacter sp.]